MHNTRFQKYETIVFSVLLLCNKQKSSNITVNRYVRSISIFIWKSTTAEGVMNYYESKDLKKFGEIGRYRKELADKFFDYYNAVTGVDGALTKREKALIALAVAHSKQCPYCIDAYTEGCLEAGADPEQMAEAVHVAAAMDAGIDLVHSVQMMNALEKKGI